MFRGGTCGLQDYTQELYFGGIDEYSPLIRYDDALLPHWLEFSSAMDRWQYSLSRGSIERPQPFRIFISNIELPANVLTMLRQCDRIDSTLAMKVIFRRFPAIFIIIL